MDAEQAVVAHLVGLPALVRGQLCNGRAKLAWAPDLPLSAKGSGKVLPVAASDCRMRDPRI
jgi:hypothetical protein